MTENKGNLISREALKEKLNKKALDLANGGMIFIESINHIIDNAPTVEVIPTELHEKIMDKTTGELLECQSNLRPQGEWIIDNWGMYHCNYCMKEKQQLFNNFCSFCGADMRGKEE